MTTTDERPPTTRTARLVRGARRGLTAGLRAARSSPLAVGFAALLLLTALVSGTAFGAADPRGPLVAGVVPTVDEGRWWTPLTALLVPWDPFQLVAGVVCSIALLGVAERRIGAVRAAFAAVATGVAGILAGLGLQLLGGRVGEWWATGSATEVVLDPLTGIVGALLAASASMSALARRRIRVVVFSVLGMFVLYDGDSSNVYRLLAALLGLAGGELVALLRRRGSSDARRARGLRRSSYGETRILLASVVAVTAIGPIVTLVSRSTRGPFFFLGELFERATPDATAELNRCAGAATHECHHALALVALSGPGPIVLSFVPLALLLAAAWGLRRGRRLALVLAVAVNSALGGLAFFSLDFVASLRRFESAREYGIWAAAAVFVPLVTAIVLLAFRRRFRVAAPLASVRRWSVVALAAFVLLAGAYLVAGLSSVDSYEPRDVPGGIGPAAVALDTLRRFVPVSFLGATGPIPVPGDPLTLFLYHWVGPALWGVVLVAVLALFHATAVAERSGDLARYRALLRRGGGGTLGWLGTWPGNVHWFGADGESAVAYRVINGVAIALSDPVHPLGGTEAEVAARRIAVVAEFAAFCDENGWLPVFYSAHDEYLPAFEALGWQHLSVGEETLMHPQTFDLVGKPWQKVRQAHTRGLKEGITAEWTTWDALPLGMIAQIEALSEQWIAEKELPEMGFTLGGPAELKDPEVGIMLAVGADGVLQAITSWLPSHRDGRVVGWTLDFMRRADGSLNGVMEFLIASAALRMRDEGIEVLSLSGAPLATPPASAGEGPEPATAISRLLEFLARTLEPAYGFASLFRYKAKFNPTYSTIHLSYPDALALPAIGAAVGRAYLPEVSPREAVSLARTLSGR